MTFGPAWPSSGGHLKLFFFLSLSFSVFVLFSNTTTLNNSALLKPSRGNWVSSLKSSATLSERHHKYMCLDTATVLAKLWDSIHDHFGTRVIAMHSLELSQLTFHTAPDVCWLQNGMSPNSFLNSTLFHFSYDDNIWYFFPYCIRPWRSQPFREADPSVSCYLPVHLSEELYSIVFACSEFECNIMLTYQSFKC